MIVDEAQDFSSNDRERVKSLAGGGALRAFGDAGQSCGSDRDIPGGLFPCARAHIRRVPVARADAADADPHMVADTFVRFNGLERPWVIVAELSAGDMGARDRDYVRLDIALTRATLGCAVVATAEEIAADVRHAVVAGAR